MHGPFTHLKEEDVLAYLESKTGDGLNDNDLLWKLIYIAAKWKGRLRSVEGISNPHGPEASIVDLLLRGTSGPSLEKLTFPQHIGKLLW